MVLILIIWGLYSLYLIKNSGMIKNNNYVDFQMNQPVDSAGKTWESMKLDDLRGWEQKRYDDFCAEADGILLISRVIRKAGAGTMFFQSLVDSLIYAEHYNLHPWIWVNDNENKPCYDLKVHGVGPNKTFHHLTGTIQDLYGEGTMTCRTQQGSRPGPPNMNDVTKKDYTLIGNGLWQSYFRQVSPSRFPMKLCQKLPIFELTRSQIMPDMHRCSELAVRGWAFKGIPDALLPKEGEMREWLGNHRKRASAIVKKYFYVLPWLQAKIDEANGSTNCLSAHIRLTDKASGREKKELEAYLPYIEAYADASPNGQIYIATDDATALKILQDKFKSRILFQKEAMRSSYEKIPTFKLLEDNKHRSNTEALVEIYAMAKCQYFVHGYSGMAEAVVYLKYPELHDNSINIDDEMVPTPSEFRKMIVGSNKT